MNLHKLFELPSDIFGKQGKVRPREENQEMCDDFVLTENNWPS
jgi:hypothetical protein